MQPKPVIAANVGGIPSYLDHDINRLLFEKNSIKDLTVKPDYLLSQPICANQMGLAGFDKLSQEFSDEYYLEHFKNMIESCLKPNS